MLQRFKRFFGNISSWLVIGMSAILVIIVLSLAMMNYNREKAYMVKILNEKGASLIRAFEAGARTGMMGAFGTLPRLETLIRETAMQQDILYISIVDSSGKILAHNVTGKIGDTFLASDQLNSLEATEDVKWRVVKNADSVQAFEVYKLFLPVLPNPNNTQRMRMMQTRMGVWCDPQWMTGLHQDKLLNPDERPTIIIGMDSSTFEEAVREDIKFTAVISGILLLLGLAGIVSLFWAQNFTRSRRLLQNISAFSSEMIANLPEGIVLTDKDLKIRYINQIASKMLGVDARKAVGLISDKILPTDICAMSTSSTTDEVIETEIEIGQQDGKTIPTSVIATKVITEDGTFVGLMYIIKDLTLLKQLQLEIQRKDKLAVIGNLAAGVAHEVRNPLSSIKGYATYFKNVFPEGSENREAAEVLVAETERLNRVITELLEISRPSDIKPQKTELRSLLETTIRLVQTDSETGSKITITSEIDETLRYIYIDPDRFVQVLMNIYLNSIQAMPEGGLLHTHVTQEGDRVIITISDTGMGFSNETNNKMFDPYFTTKTKGTGLGLAIVQKIVEAHNGVITVRSEEGKGTAVTIALPILYNQ